MANVSDLFKRMPAGHIEAAEWGRRYADDLGHAWVECPRGDWLIWLASILEATPQMVTLAACDCAEFAIALLPEADHEQRLRLVIELAQSWAAGDATAEECKAAADKILSVYKDPEEALALGGTSPTAGYASAAVSATANIPSFDSPFGLACGASSAVLAAAQVASPNDETVILDAHRKCADLIRKRIDFDEVVGTRGFKHYAKTVPLPKKDLEE